MFTCHRQTSLSFLLSTDDRRPPPILRRQRLTFSDVQLLPAPTFFRNEAYCDLFLKILERVRAALSAGSAGICRHAGTRSFIGERTTTGNIVDSHTGIEARCCSRYSVFCWWEHRGGGTQVSQNRRDLGHPSFTHPSFRHIGFGRPCASQSVLAGALL
jgi:hypothetical protein